MLPNTGLTSAFVLHSRPYKNTSAIVKFFTYDCGVLSAVVRGVKGRRAKNAPLIQPFHPVQISWKGRSDLKSIITIEDAGKASFLKGEHLLSALYVNELMVRLLQEGEPLYLLFGSYCEVLSQLEGGGEIECVLRKFERHLLDQLGYGVSYSEDARSGEKLDAGVHYVFVRNEGFVLENGAAGRSSFVFQGDAILAMGVDDYSQAQTRSMAKRVMRESLAIHLGDKPLNSRQLFLKNKGD